MIPVDTPPGGPIFDPPALVERVLLREEGFRPSVYRDSRGLFTLGIGKMVDARHGGGISYAQALHLLKVDLEVLETSLDAAIPWWRGLSETRRTVILSMAYQMGISGLLNFRHTLAFLRDGQWEAASQAMLASEWARQTPARAARSAEAVRTDDPAAFDLPRPR